MKNFFNNKKFKHGSVATVLTIFFIVLIVAVNFVATALSERFPLKIDVTDLGLYSFEEQTKEYLKDLDKDVKVTLISSTGDTIQLDDYYQSMYYQYYGVDFNAALNTAGAALESFVSQSGRISYSVVDIDEDPAFVSQFQTKHPSETLQNGQVLVECGDNLQIVSYVDMIYIDTENTTSTGAARVALKTEKMMLSAIMAVTADDVVSVMFTTGHNETTTTKLQSLLNENTYEVGTINLGTQEIEEDVDVIVINSPLADFTLEEIKKLDTFLENGGKNGKNVVFFGSATQGDIPMLKSFLNDWGIVVHDGAVVETDKNRIYDQYGYSYYLDYTEEDINSKYINRTTRIITGYAVALSTAFEAEDARETMVLLTVPETASLYPLDMTQEEALKWTPETAEQKGPFSAAILGTKRRFENNQPLESHVVAFSSAYIVSDTYLSYSAFDNSNYILDIFAKITGHEQSLDILSKEITIIQTGMTSSETMAYMIAFVVVLPLLLVAGGLVMWLLRRNK